MAQAFAVRRVGQAVWPEVAALGVLALGHIVGRAVDGAMAWNRPFRRVSDWAHVGVLGGTLYCLGTNRAPDISKAVLYGNSMLLVTAGGDWLYQKTVGPAIAKTRAVRLAEKQVRERGGGGGQGGGQLTESQKQLLLEAARIVEGGGARQTVGAGLGAGLLLE